MDTITLKSDVLSLAALLPERHAVAGLLAGLDQLAEQSPHFIGKSPGRFESGGEAFSLPRYLFLGPQGGGDRIRIGIFATLHGDEREGALALTRFVTALGNDPDVANGYALFIYPVCNPTGFEDHTSLSRSGKDLSREFWRRSAEPEIRHLESEICVHAFDGIIVLQSDPGSDGLYAFVSGDVLSRDLIEPALRAAEQFLPRNQSRVVNGFRANPGVITDRHPGVLKSLPGLLQAPFEITLETPRHAPLRHQVEAFNAALTTILVEYRRFIAISQNI